MNYLPKENYENIGSSLSARFKMESPTKTGGWGLGNIDRMQTKIQSILDEKKFRYWIKLNELGYESSVNHTFYMINIYV